jgi:hypothetical protein
MARSALGMASDYLREKAQVTCSCVLVTVLCWLVAGHTLLPEEAVSL